MQNVFGLFCYLKNSHKLWRQISDRECIWNLIQSVKRMKNAQILSLNGNRDKDGALMFAIG